MAPSIAGGSATGKDSPGMRGRRFEFTGRAPSQALSRQARLLRLDGAREPRTRRSEGRLHHASLAESFDQKLRHPRETVTRKAAGERQCILGLQDQQFLYDLPRLFDPTEMSQGRRQEPPRAGWRRCALGARGRRVDDSQTCMSAVSLVTVSRYWAPPDPERARALYREAVEQSTRVRRAGASLLRRS